MYKNLSDGIREAAKGKDTPLKADSVHLSQLTKAQSEWIDSELAASMHYAQDISSLVHSLRKKEKIKVRQPLHKILVPILKEKVKAQIQEVEALILTETNVKEIEYIDDASGILVKKIKPNFRELGKKYGPKMKAITGSIHSFGKTEIAAIERDGQYSIDVEGEEIRLTLEDVEIISEDIPGWLVASENGLTVALDITLTDDLKKEGLSRDMVNRIQNLRKERGLEVQDKVAVTYQTKDPLMSAAIDQYADYIKTETLTVRLEEGNTNGAEKLDIDGVEIFIHLEKSNE